MPLSLTGRLQRNEGQRGATHNGDRHVPARTMTDQSRAARLDELRAQATFARERYDLYKARTYGPRPSSPARLRELERESTRAAASLRFALDEAAHPPD